LKPTPEDVVFHELTHKYYLDGMELTSVTYALASVGVVDFSMVNWEVLERAKLVGDIVHEIARLYALNELDEDTIDKSLWGYYLAIKKYFEEHVKKIISVESRIFDKYNGYAGRTDIVYYGFDGRVYLDDYKTGVQIPLAARLQTAAYQRAYTKNYNIKIHARGGVYLNYDGTFKRYQYSSRQDFHSFIQCLGIARLKDANHITT